MNGNDTGSNNLTRRRVLALGAGVTGAAVGVGTFAGSVAAWDRFDVDFKSSDEVWIVVGNDLHYDPPGIAHLVVEIGDRVACRMVEFTEEATVTVPREYGEAPVFTYFANDDERILGVLPYNIPPEGHSRFSRPQCVMVNPHIDDGDRVREATCVEFAVETFWDGRYRECWWEPLDS